MAEPGFAPALASVLLGPLYTVSNFSLVVEIDQWITSTRSMHANSLAHDRSPELQTPEVSSLTEALTLIC